MANEGSTKATYSELIKCSCDPMNLAEPCDWCLGMAARRTLPLLESELARVRGLLQRRDEDWRDLVQDAIGQWGGPQYKFFNEAMARIWEAKKQFDKGLDVCGNPLEPSGAESANIGKLDSADKSGVEMGKVNKFDAVSTDEEAKQMLDARFAGSAETGGEKVAPQKAVSPPHPEPISGESAEQYAERMDQNRTYWECVYCKNRWYESSIDLEEILCGCGKGKGRWGVVNGHLLTPEFPTKLSAFSASSGVEGAHEGTTADKSVALAESSLSPPPRKLPVGKGLWEVPHYGCDYPQGGCDCYEGEASPELLPTQLPKEK